MDQAYLGSIVLFAGTFAPRGWAFCNGQLLAVNQYQALFTILGNTYGGTANVNFALPDLRGRVPAHAGYSQGPGLQLMSLGEKTGTNTNTLTVSQLPQHNHMLNANATATGRNLAASPTNNFMAQNQDASGNFASTADTTMNTSAVGMVGGNQPVNNMQPTLGLNYIICVEGLYPSRN